MSDDVTRDWARGYRRALAAMLQWGLGELLAISDNTDGDDIIIRAVKTAVQNEHVRGALDEWCTDLSIEPPHHRLDLGDVVRKVLRPAVERRRPMIEVNVKGVAIEDVVAVERQVKLAMADALEAYQKTIESPPFNHMRGDGPMSPCPACLPKMHQAQLVALVKDQRERVLSVLTQCAQAIRDEGPYATDNEKGLLSKLQTLAETL